MKISILFRTPDTPVGSVGDNILSHCSLDRAIEYACADNERQQHFLRIIQTPMLREDDIRYRREILNDLKNHPETEAKLRLWANRFQELIQTHRNLRKDARRNHGDGKDAVTAANNIRISQAICLKRGILFLREALALLSDQYESEGLNRLKSALKCAAHSEEADEVLALCGQIENTLLSECAYRITLNGEGTATRCEQLCPAPTKKEEKKRFSLFRRDPPSPSYRASTLLSAPLLSCAVKESAQLLEQISEELFSRFGDFGAELSFYRTALEWENALKEKGIPLFYPRISDRTELKKIHDPFLLLTDTKTVANDFCPKGNGTLIFGPNSGGKTVYLRSIMTAQLLTQAGLPIPAQGTVRLYHAMESIFAEAERDTRTNRAGRFEQEVRDMAEILDRAKQNTLIFFNEPFQTTDPGEGAEGLSNILHYLSREGIDWIAVTHLHNLKPMFIAEEATVLTARDGYRIREENE